MAFELGVAREESGEKKVLGSVGMGKLDVEKCHSCQHASEICGITVLSSIHTVVMQKRGGCV